MSGAEFDAACLLLQREFGDPRDREAIARAAEDRTAAMGEAYLRNIARQQAAGRTED